MTNKMTLAEMYRDYINNFVTVHGFAAWHNIDTSEAHSILERGRLAHNRSNKA